MRVFHTETSMCYYSLIAIEANLSDHSSLPCFFRSQKNNNNRILSSSFFATRMSAITEIRGRRKDQEILVFVTQGCDMVEKGKLSKLANQIQSLILVSEGTAPPKQQASARSVGRSGDKGIVDPEANVRFPTDSYVGFHTI